METILLTGATGYVGGKLLQQFIENDQPVRCLVRRRSALKDQGELVEVVQGDVLDKGSLLAALKGIDVAYYLVHSMDSKRGFQEKDREGAKNFAEACAESRVKRIIYLGGLGEGREDLSDHLRSRQEVGDVLRAHAGQTQVVEFRASIILGAGSLSFEMIRALCERLPVMITPTWVWTKAQPIYIEDVLKFLTRAAKKKLEGNPIFEIGGADRVSYGELMKEYGRQKGLRRFMLPVPFLTPYLSSLWLGLVTPIYARVGRKLVESACYPTVVEDMRANEVFAVEPTGVVEGFDKAFKAELESWKASQWVEPVPVGRKVLKTHISSGSLRGDHRRVDVNVSPRNAFAPIARIGGERGYYFANFLWKFRGFIDSIVGGVGYRRGRKDPYHIEEGDVIDFWRVVKYVPNHLLRLEAEMKLPGRAWLEYYVDGTKNASSLYQTAIFQPRGLWGLVYWYAFYPLHAVIFYGMLMALKDEARIEGNGITELEQHDPLVNGTFFWSRIRAPADEVFRWHTRPGAFERLQPPWAKMDIEQTGEISENSKTIFRVKKWFLSFRWVALHIHYKEGKEFTDIQEQGPFPIWKHIHAMYPDGSTSSILLDSVFYRLPLGRVGKLLFRKFIERQLKKMFHYRQRVIQNDLERHKGVKTPMKILVSGASGFVGSALVPFLTTGGHDVKKLVRSRDQDGILWDPVAQEADFDAFEGADVVVHLAGENIGSARWTEEKKKRIYESGVHGTRFLVEGLTKCKNPPKTLICASAVGIYGSDLTEKRTEESPPGTGFLAEVCEQWEKETLKAKKAGIRVVNLRLGLVMDPRGGVLKKVLPLFRWGAGGVVGSGKQYMSWIALDDLLGAILFAAKTSSLEGPVNAVAPHPVTNEAWTKTLGSVLRRPTFFPLPTWMARLAFGEMADETLLSSCRAVPMQLEQAGFVFRHPELKQALKEIVF